MNKDPNFDFYSFNFTQQPAEPQATPSAQTVDSTELPPLTDLLDKRPMRRAYSRVGWAFVAMVLAWYFCAYAFGIAAMLLPFEALKTDVATTIASTLPLYAVGIPVLLLCMIGVKREIPRRQRFGAGAFFMALAVSFSAMFAGSMIGNSIMSQLSMFTGYSFESTVEAIFDVPFWLSTLLTAVCAPVFEELIFRKLMMDRLLPYGEGIAIFTSALLFGLMHGNFYQFFYATLIGLVLGYVYARSGKCWLTILIHMIINVVGGVIPSLILERLDVYAILEMLESVPTDDLATAMAALEPISDMLMENWPWLLALAVYELLYYATAIVGLILLIKKRRTIHQEPRSCELPRGQRRGPAFGNAGMIVSIVLCGTLFLLSLVATATPLG